MTRSPDRVGLDADRAGSRNGMGPTTGTIGRLTPGASVRGIFPDAWLPVVGIQWFGSEVLELTYKDPAGRVANQFLYPHDEPFLEIAYDGGPWGFDGDGVLFGLVAEAHRIRLARRFDTVLGVESSPIDPSPHQIMAVY